MSYRSRVVAHGPDRGEFKSRRAASRPSSSLRATAEAPASKSIAQLRVATDSPPQTQNRLPERDQLRSLIASSNQTPTDIIHPLRASERSLCARPFSLAAGVVKRAWRDDD